MTHFPRGFIGGACSAGLKSSGARDLALIVNVGKAKNAAAVFTKNRVKAAPVIWSQQVLRDGQVAAVLLNSGGANACTGPEGFATTHRSAESVARAVNISAGDVVVCSTGMIGVPLPLDLMTSGIEEVCAQLSDGDLTGIAHAIMTTDSVPKIAEYEGNGWKIAGIAKGAGMLAPSLATMLVVIMTDAVVDPARLDELLRLATARTFDRIDSDGCMSTNDTVLLMVSGESSVEVDPMSFLAGLEEVCARLAKELIADAEGHTKVVEIVVRSAMSEGDALEVGRAIARNNLLKCAINGEDPNWGRILAAIGTTSAQFDPMEIDVSINGVLVCKGSAPGQPRDLVDMSGKAIRIEVDLHSGEQEATIWTNDLSAMYVHENSAYST